MKRKPMKEYRVGVRSERVLPSGTVTETVRYYTVHARSAADAKSTAVALDRVQIVMAL